MGSQLDKFFRLEHSRYHKGKRDMQMPTVHIRKSPRRTKSDAVIQQIEGLVHHIILPRNWGQSNINADLAILVSLWAVQLYPASPVGPMLLQSHP